MAHVTTPRWLSPVSRRIVVIVIAVAAALMVLTSLLVSNATAAATEIIVDGVEGDACRYLGYDVDAKEFTIPSGGRYSATFDLGDDVSVSLTSPSNRKFVDFRIANATVDGAILFNRTDQDQGTWYDYNPDVDGGILEPPPRDSGDDKKVVLCFKTKASPSITVTPAQAEATVGDDIGASATVSDGVNFDTGSQITFSLHTDASCASTEVAGSSSSFDIADGPIDADDFTTSTVGIFYWKAAFPGDTNNEPASGCSESVTVSKASPSITVTAAQAEATVGDDIGASATVSDGVNFDTGSQITFSLHTDASCASTEVAGSSSSFDIADGPIDADDFTTSTVGIFYWKAAFPGDTNNEPASGCSASVTVSNAAPTVTAAADEVDVVTGTPISATAELASGFFPVGTTDGGTITFELFAADTCTGEPVATANPPETVTGNGTYISEDVATDDIAIGTYFWKATYSGDGNNAGGADCGAEVQIYQQGVACGAFGSGKVEDGDIALGVSFERGDDLIAGKDSCEVGPIPVTLEITASEVTFDFPTNEIFPGARFIVRIDWTPGTPGDDGNGFPIVNPLNPPDRRVAYDVNGVYVTGVACAGSDASPGALPTTEFRYDHPAETPVCLAGEQLLLTPDGWQQIQFWDVLYDPKWSI